MFIALQLVLVHEYYRARMVSRLIAWPTILFCFLLIAVGYQGRNEMMFLGAYFATLGYFRFRAVPAIRWSPPILLVLFVITSAVALSVGSRCPGLGQRPNWRVAVSPGIDLAPGSPDVSVRRRFGSRSHLERPACGRFMGEYARPQRLPAHHDGNRFAGPRCHFRFSRRAVHAHARQQQIDPGRAGCFVVLQQWSSPIDAVGDELFHSCGRGVLRLARSVCARTNRFEVTPLYNRRSGRQGGLAAAIANSIGAMAKVAILPWDIRAAHVPAAGNSIVNNIYKNGSYVSLNPTWHAEDSGVESG